MVEKEWNVGKSNSEAFILNPNSSLITLVTNGVSREFAKNNFDEDPPQEILIRLVRAGAWSSAFWTASVDNSDAQQSLRARSGIC